MRDLASVFTMGVTLTMGVILAAPVPAGAAGQELPPWGVIASPNQGQLDNALKGIAGVAANDLWAVGEYNPGVPPTATGRRTLIEHWDGVQWSIVPSPNPSWPGMDYATLEDVAALSPTDAWAVGYSQDFASLKLNTLIQRWNGTQWKIVRSPNPAGTDQPNQLFGVAAESANSVWAVGMTGLFPDDAPLILHWTGLGWKRVPNDCQSPQTLGYAGLNAVLALGPNDVWAAGDAALCHYDGQGWTVVPSPQPRPEFLEIAYPLLGLSGTGPNDVWAVGARIRDLGDILDWSTLIEHWDGTEWTAYYLPGEFMSGVAAVAPDDVWAVGTDGALPVILHYDGAEWSAAPAPPPPGLGGRLAAALALGAGNLWAVGQSFKSDGDSQTFVIHAPNSTGGNVAGDTGVSGAVVTWFGPENGSTETDVSGAYVAVDLVAGDYFVTAQFGGCAPASAQVTVLAGTTVMQDLVIDCP
jgi:hypothetical protein